MIVSMAGAGLSSGQERGAGTKPALSGPSFRDEAHARQALEMPIARQQVCAMSLGCRVDDSVRRRELRCPPQSAAAASAIVVSRSTTTHVSVKAMT
jgi:hypothetical protein